MSAPEPPATVVEDSPLAKYLLPPRTDHEIGTFAHFHLQRELGTGGMSIVYQAEDSRLQRPVALKVLHPEQARNDIARQRFLREARLAASVRHENVVTIYDVHEHLNLPYISMERLIGTTLERWMDRHGRPSLMNVVRISREILRGLHAAHMQGLVHRDIKPSNIFLENPTGRVRLLDFGLAVPLQGGARLTTRGVVLGTPRFMSPEQAAGEDIDCRSDLFSLGVVMYYMTTAVKPFDGSSPAAVIRAIFTDEPTPVVQLNPAVPFRLADFIHRLLAKNPDERPDDAAAALAEITGPPRSKPKPAVKRPPPAADAKSTITAMPQDPDATETITLSPPTAE